MDLQTIASIVILIGSVAVAITNIFKFFGKPIGFFKKKKEQELDRETQHIKTVLEEILPKKLYNHDIETRDRYKGDRQNYLQEIKSSVLHDVEGTLQEILELQKELKEEIEKVNRSTKDMLRQRIMYIYEAHKEEGKLPLTMRENLDELYNDYTAQGGNSYITKYYKRMLLWEIINDINMTDEDEE